MIFLCSQSQTALNLKIKLHGYIAKKDSRSIYNPTINDRVLISPIGNKFPSVHFMGEFNLMVKLLYYFVVSRVRN